METAYLSGLAMGLGLIVVLGPQNLFVLANGVGGKHLLLVPAVCFSGDLLLILVGLAGFGTLVRQSQALLAAACVLGIGFLGFYGYQALARGLGTSAADPQAPGERGRKWALGTSLALTFANPQVYFDTVVVLGASGARFADDLRAAFGAGAVTASFVWFFGLSLAGRTLAPVFRRPKVWRVLNLGVAFLLWSQALALAFVLGHP